MSRSAGGGEKDNLGDEKAAILSRCNVPLSSQLRTEFFIAGTSTGESQQSRRIGDPSCSK